MPAAVSSVSASAPTPAQSTASTPQPVQAGGTRFQDQLNRAQKDTSTPDADSGDAAAADTSTAASGGTPNAATSVMPGGKDKSLGKKSSRQVAADEVATVKKGAAKVGTKALPAPETDPTDDSTSNQRKGTAGRKQQQKKTSAAPTADVSAAAVSNTTLVPDSKTSESADPAVDAKLTKKDAANGTDSNNNDETSAVAVDPLTVEDVPETDATLKSASASSSKVSRSAKRSGNAPENDADQQTASASDVAAGLQALNGLVDGIGGDGTSDSSSSGSTTPITKAASKTLDDPSAIGLAQNSPTDHPTSIPTFSSTKAAPVAPPEAQFADANRAKIVSGITGKLLPDGGSMNLTLDPANLGPLQVRVEMKNGVMSASFETSNDQASKLLTHSLADLKSALEAQGVTVEKLHVGQAPRQQSSSGDSKQGSSEQGQNSASQQEQQRKEMVRRMWRKLMKGQDPLDLVA